MERASNDCDGSYMPHSLHLPVVPRPTKVGLLLRSRQRCQEKAAGAFLTGHVGRQGRVCN